MTRLATDVGGTFTDLVAYDEESGRISIAKTLTTVDDQSRGVLNVIDQACAENGFDPGAISFFVHGGTTVINALTERKGVKTALVTTRGFRDVLEIGRGNRPDLYNLQARTPEPYVRRRHRFEITERLNAKGEVIVPLDEGEIAAIAETCARDDIEAVAVVFLHSYVNHTHEERCADLLRERLPGVTVSASNQISRQWREYERTNTAVMNAYVQPIIARYFRSLERKLTDRGVSCDFFAMQSNGGVATFGQVCDQPLTLVESGPSGGIAGAVRIGEALGTNDILSLDVGGTTAKCSLIRNGRPQLASQYKLQWTRTSPGYPVQVPVVDIVEIGAGGGSLAWVDDGDILHVGPQSAGSKPGPVCYSRGGLEPTITDAKLVTGVLDPKNFANGQMALDVDAARKSFLPIADRLGCNVEEAAAAVISIAEANMINALKLVTVQRGHDPRGLALVVSGGAGPMLAARLGRELMAQSTIIPVYPGIFSAWGMLAALPKTDLRRTYFHKADVAGLREASAVIEDLVGQAVTYFGAENLEDLKLHYSIEARYSGQEHSVAATFEPGETVEKFLDSFHSAHETAYTFKLMDNSVEITNIHLQAELKSSVIGLAALKPDGRSIDLARKGDRRLYLGQSEGWGDCPVLDRDKLPIDEIIDGPVLIEEATSTTLVLPGQTLQMSDTGLLIIMEK
jgi:N-methylhydantoinase A